MVYSALIETRSAELQALWARYSLQSAVVAGLFAGGVLGWDQFQEPRWLLLPYSLFGMAVTVVWWRMTKGGYYWLDVWNKELRAIEKALCLLAPANVFTRRTNVDPDAPTVRRVDRVRPWACCLITLFGCAWVLMLGWSI